MFLLILSFIEVSNMKPGSLVFIVFIALLVQTSVAESDSPEHCDAIFRFNKTEVIGHIRSGRFSSVPRSFKCYYHCVKEADNFIRGTSFTEAFVNDLKIMCIIEPEICECYMNLSHRDKCEYLFNFLLCSTRNNRELIAQEILDLVPN